VRAADRLKALDPAYVSVTWGAGGSTGRNTIDTVDMIRRELGIESMLHLTCVGTSKVEIDATLVEVRARGIENIMALRGDPPKGNRHFKPHPEGFRYGNELVSHIHERWDFCTGVAGYPEGHPEAPDKETDLQHLKRKVESGAEFIVTQLFFANDDFFDFEDRARAKGITVPILPGIMPITNVSQIKRFTDMCGARIPSPLLERLESIQGDPDAVIKTGIEHATHQCEELLLQGAKGIHFYTLNRSHSTMRILENLRASR